MVEHATTHGFWPSLYEPFRTLGHRVADFFSPPSEAGTDDAGYQITLELPGVSQDDIEVSIHESTLTVTGEKRSQHSERAGSVYFCERQYGRFQRTFRLPADADHTTVSAAFKDGVLTLTVPRTGPDKKTARKIKIG